MCQATPRAERELPVSHQAPALARDFLRAQITMQLDERIKECPIGFDGPACRPRVAVVEDLVLAVLVEEHEH